MNDWQKFLLSLLMFLPLFGQAQVAEKIPPQFGVRFGYGLEFPSKNNYRGEEFALFEAGHRLNFGGFVNLHAEPNVQFSPFFGLEHVFWPKGEGYRGDCEVDSFPSFYSVDDSIPGRNFRMYNLIFEPAFRFYVPKKSVWIKLAPHFSYVLRTRVENYSNTCGARIERQWLAYEESDNRSMSNFNFGLGFGMVKEVQLGTGSYLSLDFGFRAMLSQLLKVNHPNPDAPDFTLYPWGFYLNLSFFR